MSDICGICREELISNIKVLECKHSFHEECINAWIERCNVCPFCRQVAVPDFIKWKTFDYTQPLTESFIRKYCDNINWNKVCITQSLSEEFMREFSDFVNWSKICQYQSLSEEFIREFSDFVNWTKICQYQSLSEEFMREFS